MEEHKTFMKRQDFIEFKRKTPNFIMKFTADWCGPCKQIAPFFDAYCEQVKEYFDVVIIDSEKGSDICSSMKIKYFPTFYSFVDGEVCEILIGADEKQLKNFFTKTVEKLKSPN